MSEELEYGPDILSLVDEDGVEHSFELIDSLDVDDKSYVALIPVVDDDSLENDDGELIILRIIEEDGQEFLEAIEDEDEFNEISAMFMERLEDFYDIEEE